MTGSAPLDGITVLDLTQIYNGPYATFLLAQAGAEIIKIEPLDGEHLRKRTTAVASRLPYAMINAGKRSLCLDLKTEPGRDILLRLVPQADVLVENFAPGVMDRLGLGAAELRQVNPRLIYASSSGYGSSGPYRDYPAMDLTVQAMAGIIGCTGYSDQPPVKAGPAICDFNSGIHLYGGILTALLERERTGRVRTVEVSMMEAAYVTLSSNLGLAYAQQDAPERTGNRHGGLSLAPYNVYPSSDGFIAVIANNDAHWQSLLRAFARNDLARDQRFQSNSDRVRNMDAVDALVGELTRPMTRQAAFELLISHRVPCAPVRTLQEVINDPHLHARGTLRWVEHPEYGRLVLLSSPLRFDGEVAPPATPSAALGQDGARILEERLGLSTADTEQLGLVVTP